MQSFDPELLTLRKALESLGFDDAEVRTSTLPDPEVSGVEVMRGVGRRPSGAWFYFTQRGTNPPVIVKAESAEKRVEAERQWEEFGPGGGPSIASATPDLPERGEDWHHEKAAPSEEQADPEDDPIARLRGVSDSMRRLSGSAPLQKAAQRELPDWRRRYLEHLGYPTAQIEAGNVALPRDQAPAAVRYMAKSLRGSLAALRAFADDEER